MTDATELDAEHQQDDIEARARSMGWRPKEEFRGAPEKWTDAVEFVRRGEEILPIVNAQKKKLEEELAVLKSHRAEDSQKMAEMSTVIGEFGEQYRKGTEAAYKRGRRELEEERAVAVAQGDTAKFNQVQAKIDELDAEHRPAVQPPKAPEARTASQDGPKIDPYVHEWVSENPWFSADREAKAFATGLDADLMASKPDIRDRLTAVREAVKKRFPEHFTNSRRDSAAAVATPSGGEARAKKGPRYEDLPADAKAACDRFVSQKVMTREQYLKDYDWN